MKLIFEPKLLERLLNPTNLRLVEQEGPYCYYHIEDDIGYLNCWFSEPDITTITKWLKGLPYCDYKKDDMVYSTTHKGRPYSVLCLNVKKGKTEAQVLLDNLKRRLDNGMVEELIR